jgi:hypothetical protein
VCVRKILSCVVLRLYRPCEGPICRYQNSNKCLNDCFRINSLMEYANEPNPRQMNKYKTIKPCHEQIPHSRRSTKRRQEQLFQLIPDWRRPKGRIRTENTDFTGLHILSCTYFSHIQFDKFHSMGLPLRARILPFRLSF